MPIPPLYGHEGIRNRLVGAIASGRLPQALLFEGPQGVGKQRLALWLAQALVCENPSAAGGCGTCQGCRLVLSLSHPDVHWFVPLEPSRSGSADADKQVDLVREALGEEMAERREHPLWEPPSGLAIHGIAAVRLLLRELALKPALGRRKVFVIGDAERLVPQTGTEAAANALLKALEEPPVDTTFVLTTSTPEALLPTVLSRVVRVRLARLADSVVTAFVQRELGVTAQRDVAQRVAMADGRPGRLLADRDATAGSGGGGGAAERFLAAVEAGPAARYAFALGQQPFQARGGFTAMLDGLLERLRERARSGSETGTAVAAISRVLRARELAQGNVNPQLVAAVMADDLGMAEAGE
jgi:DNA polymerase III subunit delta'